MAFKLHKCGNNIAVMIIIIVYLTHDPYLQDVAMAREFEEFVHKDERFEITNEVKLGLVCFRLKVSYWNSNQNRKD